MFSFKFGFGNNDNKDGEGVIYKNVVATYLHGPLLPKNPKLSDYIIKNALEKKYQKEITLAPLDDKLETEAHNYILKRFLEN